VAYEVFERSVVRVDTPSLSIANGRVVFNAAARRILADAKVRAAVLLWDKTGKRMAIKAVPKATRSSYTITFSGHGALLTAKSFFQHIGWNARKREVLPAIWNSAKKMFEVDLPVPSETRKAATKVSDKEEDR
jgi:hypothetical protein